MSVIDEVSVMEKDAAGSGLCAGTAFTQLQYRQNTSNKKVIRQFGLFLGSCGGLGSVMNWTTSCVGNRYIFMSHKRPTPGVSADTSTDTWVWLGRRCEL